MVLKIVPTKTTRLIYIRCPFPECRRRHIHGWPYGDPEIGHRAAHCRNGVGHRGYRIETPA